MPDPLIRFRIDFDPGCFIGPGKIDLLEAIEQTGTLSGAARALGMSYRRGWLLLESINASFRTPASVATTGGKGGGGVRLTSFGRRLVSSYRRLEGVVGKAAQRELRGITAEVRTGAPVARVRRRPLARTPE